MDNIDITSMSSRGQVVIPLNLRDIMGLKDGEKFAITGKNDTIILKKIQMPSFKNFDDLIAKTRNIAKTKNITEADIKNAIKRARR